MSEKTDIIKACFPYAKPRPGQIDICEKVIDALDGGAKYAIIDAPTGTGKTPIAITIAAYYTRDHKKNWPDARRKYFDVAMKKNKTDTADALMAMMRELGPDQGHMITSMKLLQAQYLDENTSGLITLMQGKNNYICRSISVAPGTTCGEYEAIYDGHVCKLGKDKVCAYADAKFAAQCARMTLHNFDSFFAQASLGGSFLPRKILTIDEAHGAEQKIIGAVSFSVEAGMVSEYGGQWKVPDLHDGAQVKAWMDEVLSLTKAAVERIKFEVDGLKSSDRLLSKDDFKRLRQLANEQRFANEMARKIDRYIMTSDKPWAVELTGSETVFFEPVKGSYFAKGALLNFGQKVALLSATIINKNRVMSGLNMKNDETFYLAAPCLFPVSSRRIVDTHAVNTGQGSYEKNISAMCKEIQRLMDKHPGVRGVIHASSYRMAKDIAEHMGDPRLMTHDSKDRGETVDAFVRNSPSDAVLVGVFVKEGYDFRGDQCRFQIIPRIPYPYVTRRIEERKEMEPGYYQWLTAIDLVQTAGRGTRSADDMCVTYVIDSRFGAFVTSNQDQMPRWFTEAIEIEKKR